MDRQEPEHYPDVTVNMWPTRRSGSWIVMNASSLDERPVALSRRGRWIPRVSLAWLRSDQGLDHLAEQASGDVLGLLTGGRDRRVLGADTVG